MIQEIRHEGKLLAVLVPHQHRTEGIEFYTPGDFSQQLGAMSRPAGYVIAPHVHKPVPREVSFTKEALIIKRGRVRVDFYSEDRHYFKSVILGVGDVILLAYGGHGLFMLEESEIVEVKQGPYAGENDKIRFDPVPDAEVRFE